MEMNRYCFHKSSLHLHIKGEIGELFYVSWIRRECSWDAPKVVHDDVIKWEVFRVTGHRSPVNSHHNGQWRVALTFSLICVRTNGLANNRDAGDLRRRRTLYDATVMWNSPSKCLSVCWRQGFSNICMDCLDHGFLKVWHAVYYIKYMKYGHGFAVCCDVCVCVFFSASEMILEGKTVPWLTHSQLNTTKYALYADLVMD